MKTAADRLTGARDQLLALRTSYGRAKEEFVWPELGGTFNWAHDWFDRFASGNEQPGLIIVEEDDQRATYSFAWLVRSSNKLAAWLANKGLSKGDAVMLMLGNQVELWLTMLAVMKLGAVIMPTSTALGSSDLKDRVVRGNARLVVCNAADAAKFAQVIGDDLVITPDQMIRALSGNDARVPHSGSKPDDPLLLYFTSGTTNRPKLVVHDQVSYPVGHLSTMYWLGLRPGDVTSTSLRPDGPSTHGRASSHRGWQRPLCWSTTT